MSRTGPIGLDSPSLQLNARCRPLLRAWSRLDRGLQLATDIPADEAVLSPLKQAHLLYELWCLDRMRARVEHHLGPPTRRGDDSDVLRFDWKIPVTAGPPRTLVLAATMNGHDEGEGVTAMAGRAKDEPKRWTGTAGIHIRSWALARKPDGLIAVGSPAGWTCFAWDAKYRRHRYGPYLSGATYQAHAFRDAVRVRVDRAPFVAPRWSWVLHPTVGADAAKALLLPVNEVPRDEYPEREGEPGTLSLDSLGDHLTGGGVGLIHAQPEPGASGATAPATDDPLLRLVDQVYAWARR